MQLLNCIWGEQSSMSQASFSWYGSAQHERFLWFVQAASLRTRLATTQLKHALASWRDVTRAYALQKRNLVYRCYTEWQYQTAKHIMLRQAQVMHQEHSAGR